MLVAFSKPTAIPWHQAVLGELQYMLSSALAGTAANRAANEKRLASERADMRDSEGCSVLWVGSSGDYGLIFDQAPRASQCARHSILDPRLLYFHGRHHRRR